MGCVLSMKTVKFAFLEILYDYGNLWYIETIVANKSLDPKNYKTTLQSIPLESSFCRSKCIVRGLVHELL